MINGVKAKWNRTRELYVFYALSRAKGCQLGNGAGGNSTGFEGVIDDDLGVGDFIDLVAVDAEIATGDAFDETARDVELLDVHCFDLGGEVDDLAKALFGGRDDRFAEQAVVKLDEFLEAHKIIGIGKHIVVIDDKPLGNDVADILVEQDELGAAKTILAVEAFDLEVVGIKQ